MYPMQVDKRRASYYTDNTMKGVYILFGILFALGLLGFVGWYFYWKRKEKSLKTYSDVDVNSFLLKEIKKIRSPQTVLTDYCLKKNGFSVIVDFLVVNEFGVFVVASVSKKGKIFGEPDQKEWTEKGDDGLERTFFNPLIQNASHVRTIQGILPAGVPVRSVVVFFSDGAEKICKSATEAVTPKQFLSVIGSGRKCLDRAQIEDAVYCLRVERS